MARRAFSSELAEKSTERDMGPGESRLSTSSTLARLAVKNPAKQEGHDDGKDVEKSTPPAEDSTTSDPFEVTFDGDSDPRSPRSWSKVRKWLILIIVSTTSLCVACVSSIYSATYDQTTVEFNCSEIVAVLGLSMFEFGLALSPMMLGPLSEFYGRKPIYICSLLGFIVWIIPCAVARNIQTMLIARFFNGFAGATFLSVAGGTVGDLFSKHDLGLPMAIYTLTPFLGPQLGPLIGGFINYYLNWRWTFWVVMIWAAAQLALVIFLTPETYLPVLVRNEARRLRKETGDDRHFAAIEKMDRSILRTIITSCYRPFLLMVLEPMCLNLCLYSALLLGIQFLFFGAFNLVFKNNHGFNLWQVGLSFLGISVGMVLATCTMPFWNKNYERLLRKHEERTGELGSDPEYRLPPTIAGTVLVTAGLLWFGWTTYASVPWIVPIIGSALFGAGTLLAFMGMWTFLVESYPLYAASALAANSFCRNSFAAVFPIFGNAMYQNLGYQWATFILAMISLVMLPFPYIFYRYGEWFRSKSRYAGGR